MSDISERRCRESASAVQGGVGCDLVALREIQPESSRFHPRGYGLERGIPVRALPEYIPPLIRNPADGERHLALLATPQLPNAEFNHACVVFRRSIVSCGRRYGMESLSCVGFWRVARPVFWLNG